MFSELKFIDSTELKFKINNKFPIETSEDDYTSIITDRGTFICKLRTYNNNYLNSVTYSKFFIETSDYILANDLQINLDKIIVNLPHYDVFESILRTDTSALLNNCPKKQFQAFSAKWSPANLAGAKSVLTILNDTGSLDVYAGLLECTGFFKYIHLHNVTKKHLECYKNDWNTLLENDPVSHYEELKRRLAIHTPIAFVWTQLFTACDNKFAILIVVYGNRKVVFWKYESIGDYDHEKLLPVFMQEAIINYDVSVLHWVKSECGGLLIFGTTDGTIGIIPITDVTKSSVKVQEPSFLCQSKDVTVENITTSIHDDKLYIFTVKQSNLLIHLLNTDGELLDECVFRGGNLNITSFLNCASNTYLIVTTTGVCKELVVTSANNKIDIKWRHIYVNINFSLKKILAAFTSRNRVIYTFLTDSCCAFDMKEERDNIHFMNLINKKVDLVETLTDNGSKSLFGCQDVIEALRITAFQSKELICNRLPANIIYNELNLQQLKLYLIIARISEHVYDQLDTLTEYRLKSFAEIHLMIEIKLSVYFIQEILKQTTISTFLKDSLVQQIYFLREVIIEDLPKKYKFGQNIIDEMFDVMLRTEHLQILKPPICFICGNEFFGTSCMNKHYVNRCAISLTQILNSKYKCFACDKYVSREVVDFLNILHCPFCDSQLEVINVRKEIELSESECKEDCLQGEETL